MKIKKILFITLSNIGDAILTLPVLDALRANFQDAEITVMSGPRPEELFKNNSAVSRVISYDKHSPLRDKARLFFALSRERFDLVVDLRNSFFGAVLPAKKRTSPFLSIPSCLRHMKERHLYKVRNLFNLSSGEKTIAISEQSKHKVQKLLEDNGIYLSDKIVLVAPGARSTTKMWEKDKFAGLINYICTKFSFKVVLVGDKDDLAVSEYIAANCQKPPVNLTAKTTLVELAFLLTKAEFLVTNDSAALHLASYMGTPVVAFFGPTDEQKYGPWSAGSIAVKKSIFCRPCEKAQCRLSTLDCLKFIKTHDAAEAVHRLINNRAGHRFYGLQPDYKRILIVRTDRIGDVLLSTPVIKALRNVYPSSYIAMMVSPYSREIVEGNPYLDETIIYDKDNVQKSWLKSVAFAFRLREKKFDLAVILHPTNRVHLVTFFAGIARRIGYDRKMGFLLTDRIKHTKQQGLKHEKDYCLDLLKLLNVEAKEAMIFMPINAESERLVQQMLRESGINSGDKLLAIHPGASCPSKIWPAERFARVADQIASEYGMKILIVAGTKDAELAQKVAAQTKSPLINLAGKTSVSQLASILKRCRLFISNDSGPVHISSAVGTPVISIFGRNQKGLSPSRWGPTGKKDKFLHKDIGCVTCLAHLCNKDFACIKAITAEEVLQAAKSILDN